MKNYYCIKHEFIDNKTNRVLGWYCEQVFEKEENAVTKEVTITWENLETYRHKITNCPHTYVVFQTPHPRTVDFDNELDIVEGVDELNLTWKTTYQEIDPCMKLFEHCTLTDFLEYVSAHYSIKL